MLKIFTLFVLIALVPYAFGQSRLKVGLHHVCAITSSNDVKCWGYNSGGRLGLGDEQHRGDDPNEMGHFLPAVWLGTNQNASSVAIGGHFACAVLQSGDAKCWGSGLYGVLGQGDPYSRGDAPGEMGDALAPVPLGTDRKVIMLAAEGYSACALLDDGTVKCWGDNQYGQLGQGHTDKKGDSPGQMGDALPAVDLGTGRTAVSIAAGSYHFCAILDEGSVKCWGRNNLGQLGQGHTDSVGDGPAEMGDVLSASPLGSGRTAVQISCGAYHSCALLDDGSVKCWGYAGYGQLGQEDNEKRGDGPGEMGDGLPAVRLGTGRTAVRVFAGNSHSCAILDNGDSICWGRNQEGQLGRGDSGDVGADVGDMGDALYPIALGTGRSAVTLALGQFMTCAVLDDDSVKCWGSNYNGELGIPDGRNRGLTPDDMGDWLPAVDLGEGPAPPPPPPPAIVYKAPRADGFLTNPFSPEREWHGLSSLLVVDGGDHESLALLEYRNLPPVGQIEGATLTISREPLGDESTPAEVDCGSGFLLTPGRGRFSNSKIRRWKWYTPREDMFFEVSASYSMTLDITDMLKSALARDGSGTPAFSLLLQSNSPTCRAAFGSAESEDRSLRPYLSITTCDGVGCALRRAAPVESHGGTALLFNAGSAPLFDSMMQEEGRGEEEEEEEESDVAAVPPSHYRR